ncbi:MAG: DUF1009 domain-containing protein, partial [Puniceicoccales bacterium]|nr:DUF1009 domain-containing protein [Puniceicoccales bacterium]
MSPADSSTLWSGNSIFLPSHFHPSHKVALLAGKGQYPERVWDQLEAYGVCRHLIAFEEETSSSFFSRIPSHQKSLVNVGQVGKWLKLLETQDVRHVLMAGQITPRKLFDG